jgi:hypothetical protein
VHPGWRDAVYDNPALGDINGEKKEKLSPEEPQKAGVQEIV